MKNRNSIFVVIIFIDQMENLCYERLILRCEKHTGFWYLVHFIKDHLIFLCDEGEEYLWCPHWTHCQAFHSPLSDIFNSKSSSIGANFDAELIKDLAVSCATP